MSRYIVRIGYECDECGVLCEGDYETLWNTLQNDGWTETPKGRHLCGQCSGKE